MTNQFEYLTHLRALHMARVLLLHQGSISLLSTAEKGWPDMVACLQEDGEDTGKLFALQVEGVRYAHQSTERSQEIFAQRRVHYPFPVLLFLFAMDTDEGWYGWLHQGAAEHSLQPLTPKTLNVVLEHIRREYEKPTTSQAA
ncbi:hypothetical protein [Armatimonas sp.]|uniref:hypothetical protein n=1 Tax=Armatimonas sp. TaxID=1872638 RepID=UPI00286A0A67|nr:hypothetical protein [Armatimonas sp.]